MSLRTVRHWDAGRNRVPWSVVRLLRLRRLGALGTLNDQWSGWALNRNGLWSPEGRGFHTAAMRHWYLTIEHARLWREAHDRGGMVDLRTGELIPTPWRVEYAHGALTITKRAELHA